MADNLERSFRRHLSRALEERAEELTRRWLQSLEQALDVDAGRILPTLEILEHVPELVRRVARTLGEAGGEALDSRFVDDSLTPLLQLRVSQGFLVDELLAELEMLHEVLIEAVLAQVRRDGDRMPAEIPIRLALELQRALNRVTDRTREVFAESDEADRRGKAALLATFGRAVVHELRNRVNAARLTLSALRVSRGERGEELLDNLDGSLLRLGDAVDDVFAVALAQDQETVPDGRRRPLAALLERTRVDLEEMALAKGVEIRVGRPVPDMQVDAMRTELIVLNLTTNSIKYCDPAKEQRWVEVAVSLGDGEWRIEVSDNGIGIEPAVRPTIFEEGQRGRKANEVAGQGLGLSLVSNAVAQLGGRVWLARSEIGVGTTVSCAIPLARWQRARRSAG